MIRLNEQVLEEVIAAARNRAFSFGRVDIAHSLYDRESNTCQIFELVAYGLLQVLGEQLALTLQPAVAVAMERHAVEMLERAQTQVLERASCILAERCIAREIEEREASERESAKATP